MARAESAQVLLGDLAQTTRGRLRLHASQTVASYWLTGRMMALHEAYPHIDLNLAGSNTIHVAEAVLAAVTAGHSVSVLPRRAVESAAAEGAVRMLPVPGGERPFTVLTHPERHRTRAVEAMLDVLVR
ncbi:LysR substrate-binding domain-containing protein [Tranquillimonas rosea]|uniref:LysR substrate-binding domain-containing protein n=1 Tax=Tranquillimonas rosea TaxID=641238 RepID=UPI003BAD931C